MLFNMWVYENLVNNFNFPLTFFMPVHVVLQSHSSDIINTNKLLLL